MNKFSLLMSGLLLSFSTQAAVWTVQPGKLWTLEDEKGYSNFISSQVGPDYFKKLGSPFADLKIDCADAAYALRAYYAKVNGLPFLVSGKYGNAATSTLDSIADENKRLATFMQNLGRQNDTEEIVSYDSFPVAIKDIQPGDMFLYKIESSPATDIAPAVYSRHTYIVKNVNSNGTFDVLYSTQARRDAGLPMNRIKQYTFPNPRWIPTHTKAGDKNKWGFRRFKMPQNIKLTASLSPGSNFEQYAIATQLGEQFFDFVKEQRTTTIESPSGTLNRLYEGICHELDERVDIVAMGLGLRTQLNNACFDPDIYDTYSTPSRDGGILASYKKLQAKMQQTQMSGEWASVDAELKLIVEGLFNPSRSQAASAAIKKSCGFYKKQNLNSDAALFYEALIAGRVSFHPNDSLFNRWGVVTSTTAPLTNCSRY